MRVQQAVLRALPSAPATISTVDLAKAAGIDRHAVPMVVERLARRGLALKIKLGHYRRTKLGDKLVADQVELKPGPKRHGIDASGNAAPRMPRAKNDTLRARVWAALRAMKKATIPELLELAAGGNERDPHSNARRYLRILASAGVVRLLDHRAPGLALTSNGFQRYALIDDLGPKAPIWRAKANHLWDPNKQTPVGAQRRR